MATKTTERQEAEAAPEQQTDGPLLDLTDAAVRRMIKAAKRRGYVTYDELNEVLPPDQNTSDKIEDIYAMLNDMGINVVEPEEAEEGQKDGAEAGEDDEAEGGEVAEVAPARAVALRPDAPAKEPTDRTDDPVRMYLREMGSVELLSREGEIAIAKRIEAGREAMIAGSARARSPSRPSSSGATSSSRAGCCCATSSTSRPPMRAPTARARPRKRWRTARMPRLRARTASRRCRPKAATSTTTTWRTTCRSRPWKPS
jgi:hypothetical protein